MNIEATGHKIAVNPIYQAALVFGIAFIMVCGEAVLTSLGFYELDPLSPWIIVTSFALFYTLLTTVLSLRGKKVPSSYWSRSIISFIVLMALSGLTAQLFSGLSIDEAGSFRWLFIVLAIGYLVFMAIVRLMKKIVDIAIKQDERLRGE